MKPYYIIVVGCGGMANTWVKYTLQREHTEIVALVDINEANARLIAERHGLTCGIFPTIEQAVSATKANLVFDITIPSVHKQIALSAFDAGCSVIGEKPMANTLEDAKDMIAAAERTGHSYVIMQNRRYKQNIRSLRQMLIADTIGQPGFVCADFFLAPHFGGFRDVMASPLIVDMAIHTFDQARFITGADPVSVYCHEFNPVGSWYAGNAAAVCIFEMSDGSIFCYRGSWCAEGAPTSWEANWRIMGTKGTAIWDGDTEPYCDIISLDEVHSEVGAQRSMYKRISATPLPLEDEGHFACLDDIFAALSAGRQAETDCTDNIKSMAMVFGALESAAKGQKVLLF